MSSSEDRVLTSACLKLIQGLARAFPGKMNIDYFEMCGVDPIASLLSQSSQRVFDGITGVIDVLLRENLIMVDRFFDGQNQFFWNLSLTVEGYRRVLAVLNEKKTDSYQDIKSLVLDICSPSDPSAVDISLATKRHL